MNKFPFTEADNDNSNNKICSCLVGKGGTHLAGERDGVHKDEGENEDFELPRDHHRPDLVLQMALWNITSPGSRLQGILNALPLKFEKSAKNESLLINI